MKTIKLLALFCGILLSTAVSSQNDEPKKVQFQVRGGLNISSIRLNIDGKTGSEKSKIGFNIGGIADIALGKDFYFQPGLSFTTKGSQMRQMPLGYGGTTDLTMNAMYLQIPVYFAYKMSLDKWSNSFNIAMGPYLAYGVGGKTSGGGFKFDTFGDMGLANRPDVGLGMELQFEMPKVVFIYGLEIGITKMLKQEYFTTAIRSSNFYIGMGYKF